ncbi:ABC transporter substrate-binding protein [Amycolatopsis japonica]|uniref:ABC transporter substrate-binding protein n=1 Tax=Amycolatopsis japonica TaxID=208439 RepID=UPI003671CD3D
MIKGKSNLVFVVAMALGLTACSGGPPAGDGKTIADGTFTYALSSDPGTLDPHRSSGQPASEAVKFLYGRMIDLDARGTAIPYLAREWTADTVTAKFTLRPDLTCADGSPLTATTVADNFNYVGDPAKASSLLGRVVQPRTTAKGDDAAGTVTVTSGVPDAFLLRNLGSLPIVCAKGLQNRDLLKQGGQGTGLYTMTDAVPNDHYTLTRRDNVTWGPGDWAPTKPGVPAKVVMRVIPTEATSANLLLSGEINAAPVLGPDRTRLKARGLFNSGNQLITGELVFNQAEGRPAKDRAVRGALTQALDLGQLRKVLTGGDGEQPKTLVGVPPSPCSGDSVSGKLPKFDLGAAKTALDQAGWGAGPGGVRTKGGQPLKLTLVYLTHFGPTHASTAELIRRSWIDLGVDVTLKGVDASGFNSTLFGGAGDWDVVMSAVGGTLPTYLVPYVSGPVPPKGTNFGHVDNPDYQAAVKQASTRTGADGCTNWAAAEGALVGNVDLVPFATSPYLVFGHGAQFGLHGNFLDPASIRLHE